MRMEVIGGIIGGLVTVLGYFLVTRWQRRAGKEDEKLKKHFEELHSGCMEPLIDFAASVYVSGGYVLTHSPESLNRLDDEQLKCFKAHYPTLGDKLQELTGEWAKNHKHLGGKWHENSERVEAFVEEVRGIIEEKCREMGISLPIKIYRSNEELIDEGLPRHLCDTLLEQAQSGVNDNSFDNAKIIEDRDFYLLELGSSKWVRTRSRDAAENCRLLFISIQNSPKLKRKATLIIKKARQIYNEFEGSLKNLENIESRALISEDPKYKFKVVKDCPICKELFYSKKGIKRFETI